jgi:hypothetical protein
MNTSTRGPRFQSLGIGSRLTFRFLPFLVMLSVGLSRKGTESQSYADRTPENPISLRPLWGPTITSDILPRFSFFPALVPESRLDIDCRNETISYNALRNQYFLMPLEA